MPDAPEPPFSVIIPAHDEANVIGRCLSAMQAGEPAGAKEVIVVCNGCSDGTAEVARTAAPDAIVLEIEAASKPDALNAGRVHASHAPQIYCDADIAISHGSLAALARTLREPGVMAAAPAAELDTTGCPASVRAYLAVWAKLLDRHGEMVGACAYGLSAAGLERIGEFPQIIADDEFVRTRFTPAERRVVRRDAEGKPVHTTVYPPRSLAGLIRVESRQQAGLRELRLRYPSPLTENRLTGLKAALGTVDGPGGAAQLAVFLWVKLAGRIHLAWSRLWGREGRWLRDETSRAGARPSA